MRGVANGAPGSEGQANLPLSDVSLVAGRWNVEAWGSMNSGASQGQLMTQFEPFDCQKFTPVSCHSESPTVQGRGGCPARLYGPASLELSTPSVPDRATLMPASVRKLGQIHRLDEVIVESGPARSVLFLRLAVAGQCYERHVVQPRDGSHTCH